jgi:predicted GNAT family N-acyltransferase
MATSSSDPYPFTVCRASWGIDREALRAIRLRVFVAEQGVPAELEWDGLDAQAVHLLAEDLDGRPIATARLLASGQIGRMAVLRPWRGQGVGGHLLAEALAIAQARHLPRPWLNAQLSALDFYRRRGFTPQGEGFVEAGIPHVRMVYTGQG